MPSKEKYVIITGSTSAANLSTCDKLNPKEFGPNFSFNGTAVLLFSFNGCSYLRHAEVAQNANASVVLIAAGIPYITTNLKLDWEKIKIPVFYINYKDAILLAQTIAKNIGKKQFTILDLKVENNTWLNIAMGGFWIFLEIVILLCYLLNFILGIRSLYLHIKKEGLKPTVAQMTVWINMFSTFILSMILFDPWNLRYIASGEFILIFGSFFTPALLTSVLFLSFFFNEVLIAKGFLKPQLTTLKYPFILVCLTCWGAYTAAAYYFGSNTANVDCIKTIALMNVLFFSLANVYFVSVTVLIIIRLKTFESPILKRLIPLVSVVGFGILMFVIGSIIDVSQVFGSYSPRKSITVWTLYFSSTAFIITPQFVYFRDPAKSSKKSGSGTNSAPKSGSQNKAHTSSNKMVLLD